MSCHKCRQCVPATGDSWCIGCSGWEALQTELQGAWRTPAVRRIANDLIVNTVRTVRSLRNLSSDIGSAEFARAASSVQEGTRAGSRAGKTVSRELPPPPPPVPITKEEESDYTYEEESEEEKEEDPPEKIGTAAKSAPPKRPAEPAHPPRGRSARGDEREHRERSRSHRRGKKRKRRGERGGKKHQRLWRTLERPDLVVHRKQPASFWEQTPSRVERQALERRK